MSTREQWFTGFLTWAGFHNDPSKLFALCAHAAAENTQAADNPLATTEPAPGATPFNSIRLADGNTIHVWNYPDAETGYSALLATFKSPNFVVLFDVLASAEDGRGTQYATSPELDVWGSGTSVVTSCYNSILAGDPNGYLRAEVAGGSAPPPPAPGDHPTLQEGDTGSAVREVQVLLNLHRAGLAVDGIFGPLTKQAVENFQRVFEVTVDGIVGPVTWSLLLTFDEPT